MSDNPPVQWFTDGIVDRRKLEAYLLSPTHPKGRHKARLWQSMFSIGQKDSDLLERLIREQLYQAEPVEKGTRQAARKWELVIPRFCGPNGREGRVLTVWALDPGKDRPHLVTAFPLTDA